MIRDILGSANEKSTASVASRFHNHIAGIKPEAEGNIEITTIVMGLQACQQLVWADLGDLTPANVV